MIIYYTVPDISRVTDVIIFQLGPLFALLPLPPLTTRKIKIKKNEKNTWRYHHLTQVYQKP